MVIRKQYTTGMISVIVPVYNVEQYLEKCVRSILAQTYDNIELLLIDDGSTDGSLALCHKLGSEDHRIRVFSQDNGGSSIARNTGLDHATGEFVTFVDSDDTIEDNTYAFMLELLVNNDLDIVEFQRSFTDSLFDVSTAQFRIESGAAAIQRTLNENGFQIWKRIYRHELIEGLRFIPKRLHQDVFYTLEILKRTSALGWSNAAFYHYNRRENSVIRSAYSEKKINDALFVIEYLKRHIPDTPALKHHLDRYVVNYFTEHLYKLAKNKSVDPKGNYRKILLSEVKQSYERSGMKSIRTSIVFLLPWPFFVAALRLFHGIKSKN